jgi:hypothetical protein
MPYKDAVKAKEWHDNRDEKLKEKFEPLSFNGRIAAL